MLCNRCKKKNPDGAEFCEHCGQQLSSSAIRVHNLKCPNCNAVMDVDLDRKLSTCSYCGTKQILKESDAVEIERIRNQTHKEIELAKLKQKKPRSKTSQILIIIWATLLLLASLGMLMDNELWLSGTTFAQSLLFFFAWLVGKKEPTKRRRRLYITYIILGFLLFIPFGYFSDMDKLTKLNWPDTELTRMLPGPVTKFGYVGRSSVKMLDATMDKVTEEAYEKYVEDCKARGFTIEDEVKQRHYDAFNKEGYFLSIYYYQSGERMYVSLSPPHKFTELAWPPTELALNIPKPPSTLGSVDRLTGNSFLLTLGNMDEEAYHNYVMSLIAMGYQGDYYEKGKFRVTTSDQKGNSVQLRYYVNNTVEIDFLARD